VQNFKQRTGIMNQSLRILQSKIGLHIMGAGNLDFQKPEVVYDFNIAKDAQPALVTTSNSGIPAFLSTFVDPKLIEVLVSPMKAVEVLGGNEVKKGDWITDTAMFTVIENTGEVSVYGDYNENGRAGINSNFPQRQALHYQLMTQWGERELEREGLARIDYANRLNIASVLILNKFQNKSYFFGISGLQNYGLLNDPSLSAAILPNTKTAGGTTWAVATVAEVLNDITKLYKQLQTQMNGLVDMSSPMTLAMSPLAQANFAKTTDFNVNVPAQIKLNYPNLKIVTAPEYSTASGELVQMLVDSVDGQITAECAFTEKLRAHPIIVRSSSFKQKKSQGTWGTIIYRPVGIAQMLGV